MSKKIELTAEQLSALDQLIAQKQQGTAAFFDNIAHAVGVAAQVAQVATAVAAAVAGHKISDKSAEAVKDVVKNASVDDLVEFRKNAVLKGN